MGCYDASTIVNDRVNRIQLMRILPTQPQLAYDLPLDDDEAQGETIHRMR